MAVMIYTMLFYKDFFSPQKCENVVKIENPTSNKFLGLLHPRYTVLYFFQQTWFVFTNQLHARHKHNTKTRH